MSIVLLVLLGAVLAIAFMILFILITAYIFLQEGPELLLLPLVFIAAAFAFPLRWLRVID